MSHKGRTLADLPIKLLHIVNGADFFQEVVFNQPHWVAKLHLDRKLFHLTEELASLRVNLRDCRLVLQVRERRLFLSAVLVFFVVD